MTQEKLPSMMLEPLHLDTAMVLNAASLLLGGVSFTSEQSTATTKQAEGEAGISIPILSNLFNIGGSASRSSTVELREAKQVTLGSIHMQVVEKLRAKGMLHRLTPDDLQRTADSDQAYVEMRAVLMPLDYQAILRMLQTVAPLAAQIIEGFPQVRDRLPKLKPAMKQQPHSGQSRSNKGTGNAEQQDAQDQSWETIAIAIGATAKRLEDDILSAQQLDMVMVDPAKPDKQLGIATLNLGESSVAELQPRLARAEALIFGKAIRFIPDGEEMPLLEKTSLSQALDLVSRIAALTADEDSKIAGQFGTMRTTVEKVMPLFIQGPAVRVLAMSVCV